MKVITSSILSLLLINTCHALVPPEALVHTGVAALAGSCGAIAAYPIDFVKSQLQTEEGRAKYKNGIDATIDIVKSSPVGPFALYRGVWINILGIAPEKTIKLNVNDYARAALTAQFGGHLPIIGEMISGGIAVSIFIRGRISYHFLQVEIIALSFTHIIHIDILIFFW